jgi:hypothetical protein
MELTNSLLCERCGTEEETSAHVLSECEALTSRRHCVRIRAPPFLDREDVKSVKV